MTPLLPLTGWPSLETSFQRAYDIVIVGAGGHGLGTAYYLAKEHGSPTSRCLEKGWLGGGNTGRNTTIIRSNYLYDESAALYDHASSSGRAEPGAQLQRHVQPARRDDAGAQRHDVQVLKRHIHANRLNGVDNEWLTPRRGQGLLPAALDRRTPAIRWWGRPAAARRHRAARRGRLGLCPGRCRARRRHHPELRGDRHRPQGQDRVVGVETEKGFIGRRRSACRRRPHLGRDGDGGRAHAAGELPLQALVSEPVKPVFPCVVMSNTVHAYISQSDKGELVIGAGTDQYVSATASAAAARSSSTRSRPSRAVPDLQRG
jgi:sarcosine oxidase, subunit beta